MYRLREKNVAVGFHLAHFDAVFGLDVEQLKKRNCGRVTRFPLN